MPQDADADTIRKAYFGLARQLHPDRLAALGIADPTREAQRLFAQVNTAFAILSDPRRRHEYTDILRRGGEAAVRAEQLEAERTAQRVLDAEEAFRRGEMALRRDQIGNGDRRVRARDRAQSRRGRLSRDARVGPVLRGAGQDGGPAPRGRRSRRRSRSRRASIAPRFYLGRIERMLGRDQDALEHFKGVLRVSPGHVEAASEARVIEARLAAKAEDKGGGLFKRKR